MKKVGFIINSRVPELASLKRGMPPQALLLGWDDSGSPMSFMRFRWIAKALERCGSQWRYEIYRPWCHYDVVVFLKSMGPHCLDLARRLRDRGTCVIFEANVDYYSRPEGVEARFDAMVPTAEQRSAAVAMTQQAHAVIASSRHLAGICEGFNRRASWVPDNVNLDLLPPSVQAEPMRDGRLQVWWSGMAAKLFEFLAAADAFRNVSNHIHLHLVTDDIEKARPRWPAQVRHDVDAFLGLVPHTIHRFEGIPQLLHLYATGGVIVSPRFLDTPYNLAHTEWKISLGMACEMPAIASPVPSYIDVAERSQDMAVTVCSVSEDWSKVFDTFLSTPDLLREAGRRAGETVRQHYETGVVASRHVERVVEACALAAR